MKKFFPFILAFILVFLAGCNPQKTTSNEIADSLFVKKQECYKYKAELGKNSVFELEKIFYSPKVDSCLFIFLRRYSTDENKEYRGLFDILTDELIFGSDMYLGSEDYYQRYGDFYKKVKEYE